MMLKTKSPIKTGTSEFVTLHENPIQKEGRGSRNLITLFLELCLPEAKVVKKNQ